MGRKKNLNKLFDYSLRGKTFIPTTNVAKTINDHSMVSGNDWYKPKFNPFRKEYKEFFVSKQFFRCGICRFKIQADGHYQDIDHIVAKSKRKKWAFVTKNLVCTCTPCNRLKGTDNTLNPIFNRKKDFPDDKKAFLVFNPHYEKWSDHLIVEDDIFITAKAGSKGYATIQAYKLYRYQICINLSAEHESPNFKTDAKKVLKRLYKTIPNSAEEVELQKAKKRFEKLIS